MFKIVAIDSEYCSMGRWISVIAGAQLGLKLYEEYDLCEEAGVDFETYKTFENQMVNMTVEELRNDAYFQTVSKAFTEAVSRLAEKGNCVLHDKAATWLLKDRTDVLKVMIYNASMEHKIPRCIADASYDTDGMSNEEVIKIIEREDCKRSMYYEAVTQDVWGKRNNYNLLLDSDILSREKCAEILIETCSDTKISSAEAAEIIQKSIRWSANVDTVKNLG